MTTFEHAESLIKPRRQKGRAEQLLGRLLRNFQRPQLPGYRRTDSSFGNPANYTPQPEIIHPVSTPTDALGEQAVKSAAHLIDAAPESIDEAHTVWTDAQEALRAAQEIRSKDGEQTSNAVSAEIAYLTTFLKEKELSDVQHPNFDEATREKFVTYRTARDVTKHIEERATLRGGVNEIEKSLLAYSLKVVDWETAPLAVVDSLVGTLVNIDNARSKHNPDATPFTAAIRNQYMSEQLQEKLYSLEVNGQPSAFAQYYDRNAQK